VQADPVEAKDWATLREVDECAKAIQEVGPRRLNLEQRQAVASVLSGRSSGTPFALFGPPGTGKTVTLVECALQVLRAAAAAAAVPYTAVRLAPLLLVSSHCVVVGADEMCKGPSITWRRSFIIMLTLSDSRTCSASL
jgi:hypothetical protein